MHLFVLVFLWAKMNRYEADFPSARLGDGFSSSLLDGAGIHLNC